MRKKLGLLAVLILLLLQGLAQAAEDVAEVLRRQTLEMVDAISAGGAAVWQRYLDDKAVYTAEDGSVSTKAQMVEQIKPLPEGVSGNLKVIDFKATVHGATAVTNYVIDEDEVYHGHKLHCQYRTTDTWLKTPAGWRLIAAQVLALRTDPPAIQLTPRQMEQYAGRYELTPEITYEIRLKDGALEGQQTGRKAEPLRAEVADVLFVPGKPRYRKVFQRGSGGHITGFAERREAWDLVWKRVP
ncbi:MAG TPA: DUF4440 domain-containing protein [Thermoanaerobaculia bacterium]|jgi:lipopolysaccharide export LptBFGC system permease protein LptF|nr:DUF4440 domain-containing protein [Thermoanaerobaculia bacterium]